MSGPHWYTAGIGGPARSGKDTLAAYLVQHLNKGGELGRWERRGFGEPVKRIFMETFGRDEDFVETWKTARDPPPGFEMPVRSCLSLIGDGFRQMKPTVWIEKLFGSLRSHSVIADVRYRNELESIRDRRGVVILMHRPGLPDAGMIPSERELTPLIRRLLALGREGPIRKSGIPCDYFLINSGSIEDLWRKTDECILPSLIPRICDFLGKRQP